MNQLKKNLKAVVKDLKRLAQKTDKMIKQLEKLEKAQAAKWAKAKAEYTDRQHGTREGDKISQKSVISKAIARTLKTIKRRRKCIGATAMKVKAGLKDKKLAKVVDPITETKFFKKILMKGGESGWVILASL